MGLYNDVGNLPELNCPSCGEKLEGFQTKDGHSFFETVDYREITNFYTSCENKECRTFVTYCLKVEKMGVHVEMVELFNKTMRTWKEVYLNNHGGSIEDYDVTIEKLEKLPGNLGD